MQSHGHSHLGHPTTQVGGTTAARHDEAEHRSAANRALSVLGHRPRGRWWYRDGLCSVHPFRRAARRRPAQPLGREHVPVGLLGFWVSKRPASPGHPYGYDRAEDIAGIGVALAIWSSAVFAGYESVRKLVHHGATTHLGWGIVAAVVGIAGNQAVAWYKGRVGRRIQSATLMADARHSWLDAISSFGAAVGLVAVALGFPLGDPIAGIAITFMICHVGYEVTGEIVSHLMDAIDPALIEHAESGAMLVPGVQSVQVRGRWAGRSLRLDIRAEVDASTTVGATVPLVNAIESASVRCGWRGTSQWRFKSLQAADARLLLRRRWPSATNAPPLERRRAIADRLGIRRASFGPTPPPSRFRGPPIRAACRRRLRPFSVSCNPVHLIVYRVQPPLSVVTEVRPSTLGWRNQASSPSGISQFEGGWVCCHSRPEGRIRRGY